MLHRPIPWFFFFWSLQKSFFSCFLHSSSLVLLRAEVVFTFLKAGSMYSYFFPGTLLVFLISFSISFEINLVNSLASFLISLSMWKHGHLELMICRSDISKVFPYYILLLIIFTRSSLVWLPRYPFSHS